MSSNDAIVFGVFIPALLAKLTSSLDVISGGRLDWGIGSGCTSTLPRRHLRVRSEGPDRRSARDRRDRQGDDYPDTETLRLFGEKVVPDFR